MTTLRHFATGSPRWLPALPAARHGERPWLPTRVLWLLLAVLILLALWGLIGVAPAPFA